MTHIKTFRGLIVDGGQDTVVLHTNNGSMGYRIVKFQVITADPGVTPGGATETTVKIYSVPQTTVTSTIDFSDNRLLGVAYIAVNSDNVGIMTKEIIFDNMTFNQDIYVTSFDNKGSNACNYYIELEQVSLDLNENTVATLKDIRNITGPIATAP